MEKIVLRGVIVLSILFILINNVSANPGRTITYVPCIINESGCYYLSKNYTNIKAEHAIIIIASDVTLYGLGFKISSASQGTPLKQNIGILIKGARNVTLHNLSIDNWYKGVVIEDSENIRILNCGIYFSKMYGIQVWYSSNVTIDRCSLAKNGNTGIMIHYSKYVNISNSSISNNSNGIRLSFSSKVYIVNNHIYRNADGVEMKSSTLNIITLNTICENGDDGICIYEDSEENEISNNIICKNGDDGIFLRKSSENIILANNMSYNFDDGVEICHSYKNKIYSNDIIGNKFSGIALTYSSKRNIIVENNITLNFIGLFIFKSLNNCICLNDFVDNLYNFKISAGEINIWNSTRLIEYTFNATTHENYLGNYWSDYNGTDINGDGVGDYPYTLSKNNQDYAPLISKRTKYKIKL